MARHFRRRKFCRFTADGITEIDYKDINLLKQYITETGKIVAVTKKQQNQDALMGDADDPVIRHQQLASLGLVERGHRRRRPPSRRPGCIG